MELPRLFLNTLVLRPYVFVFLAISLVSASRLLGWKRTTQFFGVTWLTAFLCEFSSTRIGVPFGDYYYTGSTVGEELYIFNIPFMDSLSFTFLLFASYCLALLFLLPKPISSDSLQLKGGSLTSTSWSVVLLSSLFFMLIDVVIDPVALRGDRWFLGQLYGYPNPGIYFGVPLANFLGWLVVGLLSMTGYHVLENRQRALSAVAPFRSYNSLLLGCGLYYGVLVFNLVITFWIGEWLLGMIGCFIFLPVTVLGLLKIASRFPESAPSVSKT